MKSTKITVKYQVHGDWVTETSVSKVLKRIEFINKTSATKITHIKVADLIVPEDIVKELTSHFNLPKALHQKIKKYYKDRSPVFINLLKELLPTMLVIALTKCYGPRYAVNIRTIKVEDLIKQVKNKK